MEEVKRIYFLLLHSTGLKIKDIAQKLDLDKYYVADIMFSSDNNKYWYNDGFSLWFAKDGAIQNEEPKIDKLTTPLDTPKVVNVERYLQGHPSASLRSYINNLVNYRNYTDDGIKELFTRYRNGDLKAYDLLVKSNLKIVVGYAHLLRKDGAQMEDLIQEGNIGLLRAIELFDHTRNTSFLSYAKNWVFQTISSSMINLPYLMRLPLNQYILYHKVQKFKEKYEQLNGYAPSVDVIEIDDDVDIEKISFLDKLPDKLKDITVFSDDLDTFESNLYQISDIEEAGYNRTFVDRLLKGLNRREEVVVRLYFGIGVEPETLGCIGEKLNLTRERTRQILIKAIGRMRNIIRSNEIYDEISVTFVPSHKVKVLDKAKIGDYVVVPQYNQLGKVINSIKSKGECIYYVLGIEDRKIYKFTKDGTLLTDKLKNLHGLKERVAKERKTYIESFYHTYKKNEGDEKSQDKSQDHIKQSPQDTKPALPPQIVLSSNTLPDSVKIGDRILYDKRCGTVIDKRSMAGIPRLILEYDNGTYDNVPDNTDRYIII